MAVAAIPCAVSASTTPATLESRTAKSPVATARVGLTIWTLTGEPYASAGVIVNRGHRDTLVRQLGEHRSQLHRRENEVPHHGRVVGRSADPGPGTKRECRRDRDVPDPHGEVAAGEVVADVASRTRCGRSEN